MGGMTPPASVPSRFQCLRTHQADSGVQTRLESIGLDELSAGELVVRTRYAGINYKDSLSLLGRAKIVESHPRICGIELVGDVVAVAGVARSIEPGQTVLVHGFRTGIAFDGGYSEYVRVPAAHAMALPRGLRAYECAVLGVPGFTVAMALDAFERHGVRPQDGSIAVTGAGGAVGTLAMAILSAAGYRVAAVTRRPAQSESLRALGASEIIDATEIAASTRPLEKPRFAASIDNVGGSALSWLLRSTREGGCVASVGNAGGNAFDGSVLPFIMRGISLFGVVANASWEVRDRLWGRLGSIWKPTFSAIEPHVREIRLAEVVENARLQLEGKISGRTLLSFDVP